MEPLTILTFIGGIMLAIIGFFLRQTMTELKEVKMLAYTTSTKLEVLQKDHDLQLEYLSDKFDDLYDAMKDLTKEIKELNQKMKI
tara:strand:- start:35 stop:289 length:255 start_codon:yes stop_codon:yes gene_type:complete